MIEEPKSLELTQEIYARAEIEREFVIAPNKLFFHVINDPAVLSIEVEFIVADHMFDSCYLGKELTAYLMASDPELAEWNRKYHLSYLKDEKKYFLITEEFASGDESVTFHWLTSAKTHNQVSHKYRELHELLDDQNKWETNYGNQYELSSITEIPKAHFDILAKYITVV